MNDVTMNDVLEQQMIDIIRRLSQPLKIIATQMEPCGLEGTPPVRAILFDIYGTLFISASGDISMPGHQAATNTKLSQLLAHFKINKSPEQVEHAFYRLVEEEHSLHRERGIDFPEVRYEEIWATALESMDINRMKLFAVFHEAAVNPVHPMPRLLETLIYLKKQGVVLGIISNAQFFTPLLFPALLQRSLTELGFHPNLTLFSFDCGIAKPSRFMFDAALTILNSEGIGPEQTVYVGNDILKDIKPAREVGFRTLLYAGDRRSLRLRDQDPQCADVYPHGIITQLDQLSQLTFMKRKKKH